MKNLLKSSLLALALLSLTSTSWAISSSSRFDGSYHSVGTRSGPVAGFEAVIYDSYIYGTVISRSGDSYWYYGMSVDNGGNFKGTLYGDGYDSGTIAGRVS